jgi:hypothetical protein
MIAAVIGLAMRGIAAYLALKEGEWGGALLLAIVGAGILSVADGA